MRQEIEWKIGEAISIASVMAKADEELNHKTLAEITTTSILKLFAEWVRGIEVKNPFDESLRDPLSETSQPLSYKQIHHTFGWGVDRTRTALLKELEP